MAAYYLQYTNYKMEDISSPLTSQNIEKNTASTIIRYSFRPYGSTKMVFIADNFILIT